MIYQLLRRDPAWRLMPVAAAGAVLCILAASSAVGIPVLATLLGASPFLAGVHRRATRFQAALPISARDLFATRCTAFAGLVWLPLLIAVGVAFLKGGSEWKGAASVLLDCGAAATVTTIAVLSLKLMEIESPQQLVISLWYLGAGVFLAAFLALPAAPVLAFCAIASVALFVRAWRALPQSFQLAPLEAERPSNHQHAEPAPAIPWLILLRRTFPLRCLLFLPLVFQVLFTHAAAWPLVCSFGMSASVLLLSSSRWLHALPVARRKLLAIATALTLFVIVPYSISVAFGWGGRPGFRLGVINVVCIMLVCMSELILLIAWGSHRIRRLPMWRRQIVFIPASIVAVLVGPALMLSAHAHTTGNSLLENFLLHLSKQLPENPAALIALGAIAFAAMFRLLEKLDAQAEWPELFSRAPAAE